MSSVAEDWKTGRVLRLNVSSPVNRAYADKVGIAETPTFILFDKAGKEQRRWVRAAPKLADLP